MFFCKIRAVFTKIRAVFTKIRAVFTKIRAVLWIRLSMSLFTTRELKNDALGHNKPFDAFKKDVTFRKTKIRAVFIKIME